jgi:putative transposase
VKDGVRKNKSGEIQRFLCKKCGRGFTFNIGFEKMKHNPQAITSAMEFYFRGQSLRNTQKSLEHVGIKVSHKTVYFWIKKYIAILQEYTQKIAPQVSDTWRADEIYIKFRGAMKYVFALMDDETRYWIAQEVADTKEIHNPRGLFAEGKEIAGKRPIKLITDGLPAYHDAWKKEFRSNVGPRSEHVKEIAIRGEIHNNKIERMNGEIRDRERTMRGLKTTETPILKGMQIFHNYIRGHESLGGATPAEACGLKIEGSDKWKTLIQNASSKT